MMQLGRLGWACAEVSFRATTLGTDNGATSEAFPIRMNRDPG